jgi:hypothetical protein
MQGWPLDDSSGVWGRLSLGVLKNECDLITKPTFYPDLRSAAMSGFGIEAIIPTVR